MVKLPSSATAYASASAPATTSAASASASARATISTLPEGWRVEEKPRRFTNRKSGHVDKSYIEPGTGKKFRSLKEVQRHLKGEVVRKKSSRSASCGKRKRDEQPVPWYDEPGKSVHWVLQSSDVWKAYIDGREVPASVSREWRLTGMGGVSGD